MLYPGLIVDNTYQVCNEIGAGGMGVVYLAFHLRLNKYVVMKRLKNKKASLASLRNEVDVLKSLHHTYLPQVYDFIEYDGDLYTIIDYIEGYDLKYYIENGILVSEGQLIKWLKQLCKVLEYLHSHNPRILHLDIKPANIIIQPNGDVCLIDFGISMLGDDNLRGVSYEYSSPEQNYNISCIFERRYDCLISLDERTDIYSLGATFYQLITAVPPSCMYELPPVSQNQRIRISEPLAQIIDKSVSYDRENRYSSAGQMLKAIDGMFKLSKKYRQYIRLQIAGSAAACLLIILGSVLVFNGVVNNIRASFEKDYNDFLNALSSNNTDIAIAQAKELLNGSAYRSMMDDATSSEIYHGMGDCYYDIKDYRNASECYLMAVQLAADTNYEDIYYCDYAVSLIAEGRLSEAKAVLEEVKVKYPDTDAVYLIEAQLAFSDGDIPTAEALTGKLISQSSDSNILYSSYMLSGDISCSKEDYAKAIDQYNAGCDIKETALILRKLGTAQMKLAYKDDSDALYSDALDTFQRIYDAYTPIENDILNLAQCYLLCPSKGGAQKCMALLEAYVTINPDSCRSYIILAVAADSVNDKKAADYCRQAHDAYLRLSDEEKDKLDRDSFSSIKELYKKYIGGEW